MTVAKPLRIFLLLLAVVFILLCVYILYQTGAATCSSSPPDYTPPLPPIFSSREEETFFKFDLDQDGVISIGEVSQVLHYLGQSSSVQGVRKLINLFDGRNSSSSSLEKNGVIDQSEFLFFLSSHNMVNNSDTFKRNIPEYSVRNLYTYTDDDEDNVVSLEELQIMFANLELPLTPDESFDIFRKLDSSDDGRLQWEEFRDMFNKSGSNKGQWAILRNQVYIGSFWEPVTAEEEATAEEGKVVKHILFIRHGQSEANLNWDKYGTELFRWEPPLTEKGREQCITAATSTKQYLKESHLTLELILTSPLYRTVETSTLVFEKQILVDNVPILAFPLVTEEVTGSDDIGDTPTAIRNKWSKHKVGKNISYSEFPVEPEVWFWTPPQFNVQTVVDARKYYISTEGKLEEPWSRTVDRAVKMENWMKDRKEKVIAVVTHGDFIEAYLGVNLRNAGYFMLRLPVN